MLDLAGRVQRPATKTKLQLVKGFIRPEETLHKHEANTGKRPHMLRLLPLMKYQAAAATTITTRMIHQ